MSMGQCLKWGPGHKVGGYAQSTHQFCVGQVIVDFSATWCGPCKVISPLFEDLSTQFTGVIFLKVDVDAVEVGSLQSVEI